MQQPGARVVSFESNDQVTASWKESDISARRVVEFHIRETVPVRCLRLFQDGEVMAVEMYLGRRSVRFCIAEKRVLPYRMRCRNEEAWTIQVAKRKFGSCDHQIDPRFGRVCVCFRNDGQVS